ETLPKTQAHISTFDFNRIEHENTEYYFHEHYPLDFADIKGQEHAKRSALIAAAGMHNLLLEGSPGSGKSMIAKRLVHIMPPLHNDEILECAKLQILEGKEPTFTPERPFRSPHHSSTGASIFGGGTHKAQIGEVGLAHGGILFFDELPHFSKTVLEALREPLEDRHIRISRVNAKVTYNANFLFVGAMNPCPCGNLFSTTTACRCTDLEISRYRSRLSDPFLDRIDLYVQMHTVSPEDKPSVNSKELHKKVREAFLRQKARGQRVLNGALSDAEIVQYCPLNPESQQVIDQAIVRFGLSFRAVGRVLKVARTIADIEGSADIEKTHVLEALSYRKR
ncbi:ATP-binding protein, partial [Sulfuricurvum sp.]|uniref:YifB family Mg chelatase-like AAA ATPase n=1 Tax=Sulfuricurvum sp. TaxID=2025608 RepID=UPI0019AA4BC4